MIFLKSHADISGIRKSGRLAADALKYAGSLLEPGIRTKEISDLVMKFVISRGGKSACKGYRGFPENICISINDEVCHGIPSYREISSGDLVKIDITTILDGYFGDTAASFVVGSNSEADELLKISEESLRIGIEQVKSGNKIGKIGYNINKYVISKGCSTVYEYAGHGCGLNFHEEPIVSHIAKENEGPTMRTGMTFTIEPMINAGLPKTKVANDGWTAKTIDGRLSAQFEHTVLVTVNGCEILTLPSDSIPFAPISFIESDLLRR